MGDILKHLNNRKKPTISVVITTYNSKSTIGKVLNSLLKQTFPLREIELIIVDGNSTDSTVDIISCFIKKYSHLFNNIKFIIHDKNYGVSKARNDGINASTSDYVLILDADIILPPNAIEEMYNYLVSKPSKVVGVKILFTQEGAFSGKIVYWDIQLRKNRVTRTYSVADCILMRKKALLESGLYSEDLGPPYSDYEDIELGARIVRLGYELHLLGDIIARHLNITHDLGKDYEYNFHYSITVFIKEILKKIANYFSSKRGYLLYRFLKVSPFIEKIRYLIYSSILISLLILIIGFFLFNPYYTYIVPLLILILFLAYIDILKVYITSKKIMLAVIFSLVVLIGRLIRTIGLLNFMIRNIISSLQRNKTQ